jgi:hypothetical protein
VPLCGMLRVTSPSVRGEQLCELTDADGPQLEGATRHARWRCWDRSKRPKTASLSRLHITAWPPCLRAPLQRRRLRFQLALGQRRLRSASCAGYGSKEHCAKAFHQCILAGADSVWLARMLRAAHSVTSSPRKTPQPQARAQIRWKVKYLHHTLTFVNFAESARNVRGVQVTSCFTRLRAGPSGCSSLLCH